MGKVDEEPREFIIHIQLFCVIMGLYPKPPFFAGVSVYKNAPFPTSMSNDAHFEDLPRPKRGDFAMGYNEVKWSAIRYNDSVKNSTFCSKGVVYRQQKLFTSFFCKNTPIHKSFTTTPPYT